MSDRLLGIHPAIAIAGLLGLVAAALLYPAGLGSLVPLYPASEAEVVAAARRYAAEAGADASGAVVTAQTIGSKGDRWDALTLHYPIEELRAALASGELPIPAWRVRFRHDLTQNQSSDETGAVVTLGGSGVLLGFERVVRGGPDLPRGEARRIAAERLAALGVDLSGYEEPSASPDDRDDDEREDDGELEVSTSGPGAEGDGRDRNARSHTFRWERRDPRWPTTTLVVTATTTGAELSSFSRDVALASDAPPANRVGTIVEATIFGIVVAFLVVATLGAAVSRFFTRDYVDRSRALFVAALYAASISLAAVLLSSHDDSVLLIVFLLALLEGALFAPLFAAWLAGEADAYYAWGRRNTEGALALLTFRPGARQVAREALEGYLWGWAMLGALAAAAAAVAASGVGVHRAPDLFALDARPTPLFWAALLPWVLAYAVICLLFLPAWLHRLTRRAWVAVAGAAAAAGLFASVLGIADVRFGALPGSLSWGLAFGVATCLVATRRGWLTALFAVFAFSAFFYGLAPAAVAADADRAWVALGMALFVAPPLAAFVFGPSLAEADVREAPPPRVSQLMELARREEELNIARRVQSRLLPSKDPEVEGFEIAGTCRPATEVGGDYYDYFHLADGRFGVAVGDVSGKGVPAAFAMTLTKGFMEVAAAESREPETALVRANGHLRDHLARNTFVTMAYAILDPESRTVTCARAGHNPPALVRDGEPPQFVESAGVALGATSCERLAGFIEPRRLDLRRGDTLVFYTDGVTEAMDSAHVEFGEERLLAALSRLADGASARAIVDGLLEELRAHSVGADQHDDVTIVVVKAA